MLNIVVPMAGLGSRFQQAGYTTPKPMIPVHGVPMIEVVVNNLRPARAHRFLFICQEKHIEEYQLRPFLAKVAPGCTVIGIPGVTQGAACTVLCAKEHINTNNPLMIANSDQWINYSIDDYLLRFDTYRYSGFIMTMTSNLSKWSFIRRGVDKRVVEVVEKKVVSDEATCGIYNFARGKDFVRSAEAMIAANIRVNNEFYVAPVYTQMIQEGHQIEACSIGTDRDGMYGLGTPEDLEHFLKCGFADRLASERCGARRAAA